MEIDTYLHLYSKINIVDSTVYFFMELKDWLSYNKFMDISQIIFYGGIGVGVLLFLTIGFAVYRLKKKDEGTLEDYPSDEEEYKED